MTNINKPVEFRIVNDDELPPIVISMTEDNVVKVVLNTYHRLWLAYNRKVIGGCAEALFGKIDLILDGYLEEQLQFESMDREGNEV